MTALYNDIIQQKCELERQVLQNTLSLATLLPDEFAFRLMKSPGYMAVAAGEVIHVVKCIPLEVVLRRTNSCFTDLPVTFRNTTYYITPKSRILTRHNTERNCNPLLTNQYYIEDTWIQFNPTPNTILSPQILKPMTKLSWKYLTPGALATSGIYSEKDLENLRDHIMFPAEKSAVLHTIARGFAGQSINDDSISLRHLLDEDTLNKIYTNTAYGWSVRNLCNRSNYKNRVRHLNTWLCFTLCVWMRSTHDWRSMEFNHIFTFVLCKRP